MGGRVVGGVDQKSVLERIAGSHDATTAQVALAWLVSRPAVVAIPSTTRLVRIAENAGAMDIDLTTDEKDEIDRVCSLQQQEIPTDSVRPSSDDSRPTFRTLQEALDNTLNVTPSPRQLAEQIRSGDFLKPVRLVPAEDNADEYEVLEGRLRYWAWVIAFDGKKPVPALIDETS